MTSGWPLEAPYNFRRQRNDSNARIAGSFDVVSSSQYYSIEGYDTNHYPHIVICTRRGQPCVSPSPLTAIIYKSNKMNPKSSHELPSNDPASVVQQKPFENDIYRPK